MGIYSRTATVSLVGVALLIALNGGMNVAQAGPWVPEPGSGYTKLGFSYFDGDDRFLYDGEMASDSDDIAMKAQSLYESAVNFYGEFGLMSRVAIITKAMVKRSVYNDLLLKGTTTGLGDLGLGLRINLWQKPLVISFQTEFSIPTNYDTDVSPALGTGKADGEFSLVIGRSFYPIPVYFSAQAGYKSRGGSYDDSYPYQLEIGWTIKEKYLLQLSGSGQESTVDIESTDLAGNLSFAESFFRVGFQFIYMLNDHWQISAQVMETVAGENTWGGTRSELGVAYKW